jgi:hydrogenase maturation factor HypF (carbamoyltransferase family)
MDHHQIRQNAFAAFNTSFNTNKTQNPNPNNFSPVELLVCKIHKQTTHNLCLTKKAIALLVSLYEGIFNTQYQSAMTNRFNNFYNINNEEILVDLIQSAARFADAENTTTIKIQHIYAAKKSIMSDLTM